MNQPEIENMHAQQHACPNVRQGVHLLYRLMQAVNDQSDGWAYWKPPSEAASVLMTLLHDVCLWHGASKAPITEAQLLAAITPIKRMVTAQRKKQKKYGNTFEFDVDAALKEAQALTPGAV